ncbi:hypothetical protein BAE44_0021813 [Dichanthelium oligosanthes]|uniref:Uncharacterized protein n=1 Tax=Dichanthelium oligosanthes TaxID=888268 RepID=A0A1E5UW95_9POAL|nr:hypothetical protein BAE44_0021813 [Dichanthelium oligosanthes]
MIVSCYLPIVKHKLSLCFAGRSDRMEFVLIISLPLLILIIIVAVVLCIVCR